jgi:hypothetical protein
MAAFRIAQRESIPANDEGYDLPSDKAIHKACLFDMWFRVPHTTTSAVIAPEFVNCGPVRKTALWLYHFDGDIAGRIE